MNTRTNPVVDLNLIPIMNLVTLLIPFLLMSAQFVSYAIIESTLPAIDETAPSTPIESTPLQLRVNLDPGGLTIRGDDPRIDGLEHGIQLPCKQARCAGSSWDVDALRTAAVEIKALHPGEHVVILSAGASVPYEALVMAMDALREDPNGGGDGRCAGQCLFPTVTIAASVAAL